jgi:Family of unknown function (DUF6079)
LIPVEKREEYRRQLDELQDFLEKLQAFNTPGKLKNFSATVEEVKAHAANLKLLDDLEGTNGLVLELNPLASYLSTAQAVLPSGDSWSEECDKVRSQWQPQLLDPAKRNDPTFRQKLVGAMERCKSDYQEHYLSVHKKTRLGINEDEKKRNFVKDPRLERLKKLAGVSLLSHANLTDLQNRLANLKPCFTLVKGDLNTNPICPHCGFRPTDEKGGPSASTVLDAIDDEISKLLDTWVDTLLSNLGDPTVEQSVKLLDADQKKAVQKFIKDKSLPDKLSNELVQGIQNALSGLTPIGVKPADLLSSLSDGSAPCTVEQFRSRFEDFVQNMVRGKDVNKVRIIIEKGD